MKKFILFLIFILYAFFAKSQQTETYTQYVFNQFAINPAVAGTSNCLDIKFGGKLQWVGFENAPTTSFISVHGPLVHGSLLNKLGAQSWHGLGVYIVDDRTGIFAKTAFNIAYAYHLRVSENFIASLGFYLGGRNQKFRGFASSGDPLLANNTSFFVFPDVTLGGLVYSDKTFFGISAKQLFKRENKDFRGNGIGENSTTVVQYYFTAGTRIKSKEYIYTYVPSMMVRYASKVPAAVDLSLMVYGLENKFGLGLNLRMMESIAGIVEMKITKTLWMGYAYDFPISKIINGTSGSHEVILKVSPCGKQKNNFGTVDCPVF